MDSPVVTDAAMIQPTHTPLAAKAHTPPDKAIEAIQNAAAVRAALLT